MTTGNNGDGDRAGRQGRAATQGDGAGGQDRRKTNDHGDVRTMNNGGTTERPERQPNNELKTGSG